MPWIRLGCVVGWSDLAPFSIFENLHISADQAYFYKLLLIPKSRRGRAAKFASSKNDHSDLNNEYFFENLQMFSSF